MLGNGLMNDAWLGQTVDPAKMGQTSLNIQVVSEEHICPEQLPIILDQVILMVVVSKLEVCAKYWNIIVLVFNFLPYHCREDGMKRFKLLVFLFFLVFLVGCVTSPNVQKGDDYYSSQNFVQALQSYQLALSETRQEAARQEIEEKIRSTKEHLVRMSLAKAESLAQSASPDEISAVKKAVQVLQEAEQWDSEKQDVLRGIQLYQARINALEGEKQQLRQQALQELAGYNFATALETIQKAQRIDAGDSDLQETANKIVALHEINQDVQHALNNNQIDQAMAGFSKMREVSPVSLSFANYPLRSSIVDLVQKRIMQMELENRWHDAYILLSTLDLEEFSQDLQRIRSTGAQYYYQKSSVTILDNGDYHHAYLLCILASQLDDSDLRIFRRLQEAQDHVNKSIQSHIAVATFDSPSNDPDAGRQFSDSLISYLYSVLPYGINILERDKIDYVLKEQYADNRSAGQMLGVDLMVTGSVSLFKVDTNIDKRSATANVKVGEESTPNPEYQQMMSAYGPDTKLWPSVPPMMITRDRTQMMNYTRGTAETRGFSKVSVRIFDTQKGTISFVKDFDANVAYDSEFQDEVNEANIEYKPMRLPSETEVKEQMRREIVGQVAEVVQASFEAREHRFLNQAQFYLDRREPQLAIRPVAQGYYYSLQDNIPEDNSAFVQLRRLLPELAETFYSSSRKASAPVVDFERE